MMRRFFLLAWAVVAMLTACKDSRTAPLSTTESEAAKPGSGFYDASAAAQHTDKKAQAGVVKYELPARLTDRPEQLLARRGYTVSYNATTRTPNWVAWHLTKSHTYGKHQRSGEQFTEDADVAAPRATDQDYYNSRFDRGHMCPAGDSKWDATAMSESFLLTNVCPQNHGLNKYEWNDVEQLCREWAQKYGAVDIVCGPIYNKGTRAQRTIGRNRVWVPDSFFKVVLCRQGSQSKAIGFVYRNEGKKQPIEEAVCSVDDVEQLTGIDFFPALDDDVERRVEAAADLSAW